MTRFDGSASTIHFDDPLRPTGKNQHEKNGGDPHLQHQPGSRERFGQIVAETVMPMLARWDTKVIRHGPSEHDQDSYFLIRAYTSLEDRQQRQDAFYGSDEWKLGPRNSVLELIENFTSLVLELDSATIAGLRGEAKQGEEEQA